MTKYIPIDNLNTHKNKHFHSIWSTGISNVNEIPDLCYDLPNTRTTDCDNLHSFLEAINAEKPYTPPIQIIRYIFLNKNYFRDFRKKTNFRQNIPRNFCFGFLKM